VWGLNGGKKKKPNVNREKGTEDQGRCRTMNEESGKIDNRLLGGANNAKNATCGEKRGN